MLKISLLQVKEIIFLWKDAMKALHKAHYGYYKWREIYEFKIFYYSFCYFFSVSVTQGASFLSAQKLGHEVSSALSPESFFSKKQLSDNLSKVFQTKFSSFADIQQKAVVELVSVSYLGKKRGPKHRKPRPRPNLFMRGPMSYK